jgi:hypothetical protein
MKPKMAQVNTGKNNLTRVARRSGLFVDAPVHL